MPSMPAPAPPGTLVTRLLLIAGTLLVPASHLISISAAGLTVSS